MQIEVTTRLATCYYCLYGIDTGRKAAFDDRVEVVWGGRDPGLVVEFAAQRVDLIATDFYESGVLPASISSFLDERPPLFGILLVFILLLSACFFMVGLDEFSGGESVIASPASKHAAHSSMMLRPIAAKVVRR